MSISQKSTDSLAEHRSPESPWLSVVLLLVTVTAAVYCASWIAVMNFERTGSEVESRLITLLLVPALLLLARPFTQAYMAQWPEVRWQALALYALRIAVAMSLLSAAAGYAEHGPDMLRPSRLVTFLLIWAGSFAIAWIIIRLQKLERARSVG